MTYKANFGNGDVTLDKPYEQYNVVFWEDVFGNKGGIAVYCLTEIRGERLYYDRVATHDL